MSVESSIATLTTNTTELLSAVSEQSISIDSRIAEAVSVSENETIIPLANSVTNLITTQTLFINLLNK